MKLADLLPPLPPMDPDSDMGKLYASRGIPLPAAGRSPRVVATRSLARRVLADHPEQPDVLDFEGIEVASTPFIHELRKTWRTVEAQNMNEDVQACWNLVSERFDG